MYEKEYVDNYVSSPDNSIVKFIRDFSMDFFFSKNFFLEEYYP